jgi:hypothetical protein
MSEDPERQWAELEAHALRLLEHARELPPHESIRRYGSLLRLWHFPADGVQETWTVFTPGRKVPAGAPPLVREVAWDRRRDQQRLDDPAEQTKWRAGRRELSLGLREATLPEAELRALLAAGADLAVPIVLRGHAVGLDGEFFGLETYEVSPNVRVQWWCDGPLEWRHFTDWVAQLRGFLQRCLDQAE